MKKNEINIPKAAQAGCGCLLVYLACGTLAIIYLVWKALE